MPFVLIKNNLKLMLRSKWILVLMALLPVLVIGMLSSVFKDLLNVNNEIEEFKVGYRISEDSYLNNYMEQFRKICEDNKIILENYQDGDITELVKSKVVKNFFEVSDNDYTIYKPSEGAAEAATIESILQTFMFHYSDATALATYISENNMGALEQTDTSEHMKYVTTQKLALDPIPSSIDYYGIVEIVYFLWCGMVSLAAVISSERKNRILKRMRVTPINTVKLYLGKFVPCTLATCLEVGVAVILSVLIFGVHWGNIWGSIGILFLLTMTASALGILLFHLFQSVAVSIVVGWIFLFVIGFIGGTFQTYMYSTVSDDIVALSPQYYINRTLVEFSTKGSSIYTGKCVIILVGMLIVFGGVGMLIMNKRREDQ